MPLQLIDPNTGKLDNLAIAESARLRAAREYGAPDFPPTYLRRALEWANDRAQSERLAWRRDNNLSDDSPTIMMHIPEWGASGDGFGK